MVRKQTGARSSPEKAKAPAVKQDRCRRTVTIIPQLSRESYHRIVETTNEGVWVARPDGKTTFVNRQMADMLGYAREEMIGQTGLEFLEPGQEGLAASTRRELQQGMKIQREYRFRRKDGAALWTLANGSPLYNENGEHIGNLFMHTDITGRKQMERQRAEAALRASKERYQSLFENVPIGICEVDFSAIKSSIDRLRGDGVDDLRGSFENNPGALTDCMEMIKVIDVNLAALKLFGAHTKDGLESVAGRIFTRETYRTFQEALVCLAGGGTWLDAELPALTLDGEERQFRMTLAVPPGHEATWSRVLISLQDITRRKELEKLNENYGAILKLFLETSSQKEYLDKAGRLLRGSLGCSAVGIRALDEDGNIPYVAQEGFSREFVAAESPLNVRRDRCACARVIAGRLEPQDSPAVNPAGSFCCNDTSRFMGGLTAEQKTRFRGVCMRAGFETVAVVPIRYNGRPIGAIHIADRSKGALPPEKLRMVESIAPLIGEAVYRFRVEQELRRSEATLAEAQRIAHVGDWEWNIATGELRWSDEVYRIFGLSPRQFDATYEIFLEHVHPDDRESVKQSVDGALRRGARYDIDHRIVLPDGAVKTVHERAEVSFDGAGKPVRMVGTVHDITEHKRAEEQLRALSRRLVEAQEEERRVIARDLHDQTGQSLTMVSLSLERALRSPPEKMPAILSETKEMVKEVIGQVREMSLNLRPSILDDLGLLAALLWYFEQFTAKTGIKVSFEHSGLNADLPWDIRTTAFRIVQEAFSNVARYAGVGEVAVRASVRDGVLNVQVEDRGVGFDPEAVSANSSGISGMEERARLLGGSLTLDSAPGVGTRLFVELPLPDPPAKKAGDR